MEIERYSIKYCFRIFFTCVLLWGIIGQDRRDPGLFQFKTHFVGLRDSVRTTPLGVAGGGVARAALSQ